MESQIVEERKEKGQKLLCDPVESRSQSQSKEALLVDCLYYKATILRVMRRYNEAVTMYKAARKYVIYEERQTAVVTTFGLIMLPMSEDRRMLQDYLENLLTLLQLYRGRHCLVPQPLSSTFYEPCSRQWKRVDRVAELLQRRNFFRRFSTEQLRQFVPLMHVQQYEVDDFIFTDD